VVLVSKCQYFYSVPHFVQSEFLYVERFKTHQTGSDRLKLACRNSDYSDLGGIRTTRPLSTPYRSEPRVSCCKYWRPRTSQLLASR